jgi:hypothetical protein
MVHRLQSKNGLKRGARITGIFSGVSGTGSIISAHNVCHTLCLAVVSLLSIFGIAASSDILMFLENYTLFFWSMGIFFLVLSLLLYLKYPNCMSKKMILFNSGLLVIGTPLKVLSPVFWVTGVIIIAASVGWYFKDRLTIQVNQFEEGKKK